MILWFTTPIPERWPDSAQVWEWKAERRGNWPDGSSCSAPSRFRWVQNITSSRNQLPGKLRLFKNSRQGLIACANPMPRSGYQNLKTVAAEMDSWLESLHLGSRPFGPLSPRPSFSPKFLDRMGSCHAAIPANRSCAVDFRPCRADLDVARRRHF